MIFLSFFFLLKKLVQIYQCYAVLEIIQKRERGGGGGKGGDRRGGMETRGGERKMEKKTKKNNFKLSLSLLPNSPATKPVCRRPLRRVSDPGGVHFGEHRGREVQHQLLPLAGSER